MFEMNIIMFKTHLEEFIEICGLPDQCKIKSDCYNVVSNFF